MVKPKMLLAIAISALGLSPPAHAGDAELLAKSSDNSAYYLDRDYVKEYYDDGIKLLQVIVVTDDLDNKNADYSNSKQTLYVNCLTNNIKLVRLTTYDGDGNVIDTMEFGDERQFFVPPAESIDMTIITAVCDRK